MKHVLKKIWKRWMGWMMVFGDFVSFCLLTIFYFTIFAVFAIPYRLFGEGFIARNPESQARVVRKRSDVFEFYTKEY